LPAKALPPVSLLLLLIESTRLNGQLGLPPELPQTLCFRKAFIPTSLWTIDLALRQSSKRCKSG
jgi:hypothetical protein